ncbi:AT hook motif DNA-binding family protein [Striga asiatica]|uniref:AT-hook motif nuclear-localized protein n=1 Tax=Striga asiatica TaxID=4170 RepID=A0A5A7QK14_STRAF|nr:AT hook motif DNA-binding family protein [Striga asiatica]
MWEPGSMEMEQKGCTDSGSPLGNSESDSPPSSGGGFGGGGGGVVVPEIINMAVNISMEKNAGMTGSPAQAAFVGGGGAISGAVGGGHVGVGGEGGQPAMGGKKRGRPRKYDPDGNLRASYVKSPPPPLPLPVFSLSTPSSYDFSSGLKRGRGKPSAPGNWQPLGSLGELLVNTAGGDFTPHVLTVYTGEDVAGKILTFAQKGSRGVCVLSANGSVSNVTIRQPGSSGGLLTYEGRFEILTLTGSYTVSDNNGIKSRAGGLSVSLASPDGRVIGGCLAGMLMAASPIQVVIGSFIPNGSHMPNRKQQIVAITSTPFQYATATVTAAIPISQAAPESNLYQFPIQNSQREADVDHPNSASTDDTSDWNDSGPGSDQRPSPDINISIPADEQ